MELNRQWCDNPGCRVFKKVGTPNLQVFSYVDRRYYCTSCGHTWSAEKGTAFETLRSSAVDVVETLTELGERVSLRAAARLKHHPVNTVLKWMEVARTHTAAVNAELIQGLHIP